jgi:hypothetical protein
MSRSIFLLFSNAWISIIHWSLFKLFIIKCHRVPIFATTFLPPHSITIFLLSGSSKNNNYNTSINKRRRKQVNQSDKYKNWWAFLFVFPVLEYLSCLGTLTQQWVLSACFLPWVMRTLEREVTESPKMMIVVEPSLAQGTLKPQKGLERGRK